MAKTVPEDFAGYDPLAVFEILHDLEAKKGEFETTAQYKTRLAIALKNVRQDEGALDGVLAFAGPREVVKMTYSADRQISDADITSRNIAGDRGVPLYRARQPTAKYPVEDAAYTSVYGRMVAHDDVTYVAFPARDETFGYYFRLTKVTPERAAALKNNLRVLMVGRLSHRAGCAR